MEVQVYKFLLNLKMDLDLLVTYLSFSFWVSKMLQSLFMNMWKYATELYNLLAESVQNFPLSVLHRRTWELKLDMSHSLFSKK